MEVYSLKQKIFIVKTFYQNGNSFQKVKNDFACEFEKTELPTDNVIVELLQSLDKFGNTTEKDVENKINSLSLQSLENLDIFKEIKCEEIHEDEKWDLFTGKGLLKVKTEPELLLSTDSVDASIFHNNTENTFQRLATNEHKLGDQDFTPHSCNKDPDEGRIDLNPLNETFEFKDIKEEFNDSEIDFDSDKIGDTQVKCNEITNEVQVKQKSKSASKTKGKRKSARPKKTYKCEKCNKDFKHRFSFIRHLKNHEKSCEICHKYYRDYKTHMSTHTGEKSFPCEECGVQFKTKTHVKMHMVVHAVERPFECDLCNKTYKSRYYLHGHMKTHSNKRPYKCEVCGKGFLSRSQLDNHNRTHTGERPFVCSFCGKCFAVGNALIVHNRIHTGETSYKCDLCDKQFNLLGTLKMHKRRLHTGEKPYKCNFCEKAFCDSTTRRDHERIHTGDYPYKCVLCGKGHNHPSNLKYHMRYIHKVTTSAEGCGLAELL